LARWKTARARSGYSQPAFAKKMRADARAANGVFDYFYHLFLISPQKGIFYFFKKSMVKVGWDK
jgi:hypothetical protein